MTRVKYPRTFHHPSSPGVQSDDKIAHDLGAFAKAEVVVTEKMDGENTTLYREGFHARSLDSGYHPSRDRVAALQGAVGYKIPDGWRICGENVFARHSVRYDALPGFFLGFSVWDEENRCLSWDSTLAWLQTLGIPPVGELFRGTYSEGLLAKLSERLDLERSEGMVMRLSGEFPYQSFAQSVVKWVRPGHVQSEQHWSKGPITPNGLAEGAA